MRSLPTPLLLSLLLTATLSGGAQVRFQSRQPAVLHGGSGVAEFTVTNTGSAPVALDLQAGPLADQASQAILSGPRIALFAEPGHAPLPASLPGGQSLLVEADLSGVTAAGSVAVQLFNAGKPLGTLEAVALDAPLNLTVDGPGTVANPLPFVYGNWAILTIRNGDAMAYAVEWSFFLNGMQRSATVVVPPNGTARIALMPNKRLYSVRDSVRPSTQTGHLLLRLRGTGPLAPELFPSRSLPVTVLMLRHGPGATALASYLYVAFCLLLGGTLSLLGSSVLPNMLRKISLRSLMNALADRTSSVSTRVDSYLRVLLRLERKKVDILLHSASFFSLTTVENLDEIAQALARLDRRLTIAERLDELRRDFEETSATTPPSVTDNIDTDLQAAANQLHSFSLPDESLTAATAFLDAAEDALAMLNDSAELAKLISANFSNLQTRLLVFPEEYYADFRTAMPGVFQILDKPFDDPKNITRESAFAIDHDIAAIQIVLDYAMVRISLPAAASANCTHPGDTARARLLERECELLGLLGTLSWRALREARTLVQEMRENIYEHDVLEEIGKRDQAEIVFDTQRARPFLPVYFSIAFRDSRFNNAAAINRLSCRWTFPGELLEEGWKVCHFFQGNEYGKAPERKVHIVANVRTQRAAAESVPAGHPPAGRRLESTIQIQPARPPQEYSRFIAEALRFLIAFGVALGSLLSGALQQLGKLDFVPATIAIIALGFGADSVKNLLTQSPKKSPA